VVVVGKVVVTGGAGAGQGASFSRGMTLRKSFKESSKSDVSEVVGATSGHGCNGGHPGHSAVSFAAEDVLLGGVAAGAATGAPGGAPRGVDDGCVGASVGATLGASVVVN